MASLSNDPSLLDAFNNGIDIHSATAAKVYKVDVEDVDRTMRSAAKSVNFGIIYGISAFGLSQNIGISRSESKQIIEQYFEEFPAVKEYMDLSVQKARDNEFVETLYGRRRYLKRYKFKKRSNESRCRKKTPLTHLFRVQLLTLLRLQ